MNATAGPPVDATQSPVHATRALVDVLLELAEDADPRTLSVALAATPAGDLEATDGPGTALADLDPDTPVLSDFYFPGTGESIEAVFGVDLSTPAGVTGRFLTHPAGDPEMDVSDDLAARVLLAVPPYDRTDVRAYDRRGRRDLVLVAAASPDPDTPA